MWDSTTSKVLIEVNRHQMESAFQGEQPLDRIIGIWSPPEQKLLPFLFSEVIDLVTMSLEEIFTICKQQVHKKKIHNQQDSPVNFVPACAMVLAA